MALKGKTAVVLGASGYVGSGAVVQLLAAGAVVVAVGRTEAKLLELKGKLSKEHVGNFRHVAGDLAQDSHFEALKSKIAQVLGGQPVDHVVSSMGFVKTTGGVLASSLADLKDAFEEGLYPNYLAARAFLPDLKKRAGTTFTLTSGGLAHIPPPAPSLWLGTVKNAALNGLSLALFGDTKDDAVRVNTVCIHVPVAPIGSTDGKNQWGFVGPNTLELGSVYVAIARGQHKGQLICLGSLEEIRKVAGS